MRIRPKSEAQRTWAKRLKWSRWVARTGAFHPAETGADVLEKIEQLGLTVVIDPALGDITLEELARPYAVLDDDGRTVVVHPGIAGFDDAKARAGLAAVWSKPHGGLLMPLEDAHREGITYTPEVLEAFAVLDKAVFEIPGRAAEAEDYATALEIEVPEWVTERLQTFSRAPFPFQIPAALSALYGHRLIADPPGVGKTLSALLAAHLSLAERVVVVAPPNLVTNWAREAQLCGVDEAATVIRAGRKEPEEFGRVTVVADSLLASRPALLERLVHHAPQMLIVDEAHRMKTITAKRSRAVLSLAAGSKVRIALTGTPVVSGPHELVALLSFTGHLLPVFGGASAFLEQYCTVDRWGKLHPRKRALQDLQQRLFQRVMVRRKKADVLPFLPSRFTPALELDVTLTDYRKAVKETVAAMTEQLELMTDPDRDDDGEILTLEQAKEVLGDQVGQYVSALRIAAARTKLDWMTEHLAETATSDDPVIVWVHHREIADELSARLSEADLHHEVYLGGLSTKEQDRIVRQFQEGTVPVLIAGITAAGVGLTLTHGNRAVFLEAHWTPALMSQAVDRQHRIGQQRQVTATTAVALGTIDERIQKVLGDKGATSTAVQGDDQDDVAVLEGDLVAPRELVEELVEMAAESLR